MNVTVQLYNHRGLKGYYHPLLNFGFVTGDELGMMEDALVAYKDLENVYFEVPSFTFF